MADRLEFIAGFKDNASAGVKKFAKTLDGIRPSHGMEAAQKWTETFRRGTDKTIGAVRPVAGMLNSVGVSGLAASLSIGELIKQFKDLADSALTLKELSRQSRISTEDLQRLEYVGSRFRIDPKAMDTAINSWSGKMVEFKMHVGDFYTYLMRQNAGVAAKINADSPVDALKDTLDYLSRITDPQIQKRVADMAGLGDIVPVLGKGPDGLAAVFADAARIVKPMSEEMKQSAERFNTSVVNFNATWNNFKNDLGPSVLDPLSHVLDKLDEGMKWAAKYPGDAAAAAATIAGTLGAFWLRARIMRGSMLAGGGGPMGAAAGEMAGAAAKQTAATTTFAEAVAEFRIAVTEMRGGGLGGGGGSPGAPAEEGKAGGGKGAKGGGSLLGKLFNAWMLYDLAKTASDEHMIEAPKGLSGRSILNFLDPNLGNLVLGEEGWHAPSRYGAEARARRRGIGPDTPTSTLSPEDYWARKRAYLDGRSSFHPDDDRLSRARSDDLRKDVQEGSKAGIIQGLRELSQQQGLGGGSSPTGSTGVGAPSIRFGRDPASGLFRRGGHSGGGRNYADSPEGHGNAAALKGGQSMRVMAAMNYLIDKKGYTPEGAAIAVGNAIQESGVTPNGRPGDPKTPGGSHYMFQWNNGRNGDTVNGRRARVERYWREHGQSPNSMEANLDAFDEERKHRSGLEADWHKQHDLRNAGRLGHLFEGYGDNSEGTRVQNARDALSLWRKAHPGQAHAAGGPIRGPGGPRSDSIPAWLSNGEFVVNAAASARWSPFLHAINSGSMFADGGPVDAGRSRRRSWLDFFRRPMGAGGMGASRAVALGATAMMNGESGWGLDPNTYGWDVNGPSGGTAQWHDITKGRGAGKLRRLSDLMTFAMLQHVDWHDVTLQQAWWKHEATGPLASAWAAMKRARTARGALNAGVHRFEVPAQADLQVLKRLPNIVKLAREDGGASRQEMGLDVTIRHHPHTGRPMVSAKAGKGVKLGIRTAPTMRPT